MATYQAPPGEVIFSNPPPHGWDKVELCDRATVKQVANSFVTLEMQQNHSILLFDIRFPADGSIALHCFPNVGMTFDAAWIDKFLSRSELREIVITAEFDFKVRSIEPPGVATGAVVIYIYTTRYAAHLASLARTHNTRTISPKRDTEATVVPDRPAATNLFSHTFPADMPEYHANMLTRACNVLLELQSSIAPAADQTVSQLGPGRFDITTSGYEGPLKLKHLYGVQSMAHVKTVLVKLFDKPPALVVRFVMPASQAPKRTGAEASSEANVQMPDGLRAYADDESDAHQNLLPADLEPTDRSRRQRTQDTGGYTAGGPDDDGDDQISESLFSALVRRIGAR